MPKNPAVTHIQTIVAAMHPYDELEKSHINDASAWLASTDNVFRIEKPDIPPKHLVSYFVLVDTAQKSILLCDHIKAQLWLPSGGHVEVNEDPADTVRRESMEELNLQAKFLNDTKPLFLTVTTTVGLTAGHIDVSLWYVIRGSKFDPLTFDRSEFMDVEWYTYDEILESHPSIFDPHMQRFTKKLMQTLAAS